MNVDTRAPYLLTAFGLPHRMGYLATRSGEAHPSPMTVVDLIGAADTFGLAGIEAPLPETVDSGLIRDQLAAHGLGIVVDLPGLLDRDEEAFERLLVKAANAGASVARSTLSSVLCGDRRGIPGGWSARIEALTERLRRIVPTAERLGICIAVENHQDATTEDLLQLAESLDHHPAFGITLDTGNPLAVGQDPVGAARALAPIIRHLHLKDYTIHYAPEGYRLVRCAAGDGVVDFPAILAIAHSNGHPIVPGIEIAAQATRTIPILDPGWWECYPARDVRDLLPALRVLWQHGRAADLPYSSAWERGAGSSDVSAEEWDVVTRSAAYFRSLILPVTA